MIAVIGTFRFPADKVAQARPLMLAVIEQTVEEAGCIAYSYAQDLADPGLFHVSEIWIDPAALDRHFQTAHMIGWVADRAALGFHDRRIKVYSILDSETL